MKMTNTTYSVRTGNTFNNQAIRWFATYQEASKFTEQYFAETGESSWVREETVQTTSPTVFAVPATH
jgi:hypothetical protein